MSSKTHKVHTRYTQRIHKVYTRWEERVTGYQRNQGLQAGDTLIYDVSRFAAIIYIV